MGISDLTGQKFKLWFPPQYLKPIQISGIIFIHFLNQKPQCHFWFFSLSHPLYPVSKHVLMVQHPTCIKNLTTSYLFTTIMQVYCPMASSTGALSLFSWLSLPACSQQQNHLFIDSVRLHDFTAQNPLQGLPHLEQNLKSSPGPTRPTGWSLPPSPTFVLACSYLRVFALDVCFVWNVLPPQIHLTFSITSLRSLTTITLLEGAFLSKLPPTYHFLFPYAAALFFPYILSGVVSRT